VLHYHDTHILFQHVYPFLFAFALVGIAGILWLILREEIRFKRILKQEEERIAMLGILSHQMRTPLTSVKWYTEMLRDEGTLSASQQEILQKAEEGAAGATRILNQFLEVSRAAQGMITFQPRLVDVGETVQHKIDASAEVLKRKELTCTFHAGEQAFIAYVDPLILESSFDTILGNAIAYTPEKGSIDISLSGDAQSVTFSIKDSGIGISKEEHKKLYERFFRGDKARLLSPDGNGLGLYLAKQLIEKGNGSITCTSEFGKGTTFAVTLPKAQ